MSQTRKKRTGEVLRNRLPFSLAGAVLYLAMSQE
jgi:hypothetical protein